MDAFTRTLLVIGLTSAGWAFSFGAGSQVVSHWLHDRGASNTAIGLNHSAYYLGLALASLAVPAAIRRFGCQAAALGMVASGVTLALFPCGGYAGWFLFRFLNGCASALSLIPLETLVSQASPAATRSRNFGLYAVALTVGGALGLSVGLPMYETFGDWAYLCAGASSVIAGLVLELCVRRAPIQAPATGGGSDWTRNVLSFGTAWYQGFLEGGMLAFLTLYLVSAGQTADAAGVLMGVMMVGVIAFQVPVAAVADRLGALPVLLACYAVVGGGLATIPLLTSGPWLAVVLFAFGACCGAMYPLGLTLLGTNESNGQAARAYSWYLAMECVGSQTGAAVMGQARDWWGEASMFAVGVAAVGVVLVPWLALRPRSSEAAAPEATATRRAA